MTPSGTKPAKVGRRPSSTPPFASSNPPLLDTSAATPAGGAITGAVAATSAFAPENIILTERYLSDPSWPADLILDLGKDNWPEWSRRLELLADEQRFGQFLDGTITCPDPALHPGANWIWDNNDRSLRAFILLHISPDEYDIVAPLQAKGACAIFAALRNRHEQLGLQVQVLTLRRALDMRFDATKSLDDTVTELSGLYSRIISMDSLFSVLLINALGDQFPQLQSFIQSMAKTPGFSSAVVIKRIHEENMLLRSRAEQRQATALVATNKDKGGRGGCPNCQRMGHSVDFCIQPGGKMVGKTLEEARTAQRAHRAAKKAARDAQTAHVVTTNSTGTKSTDSPATPTAPPTLPPQACFQFNGVTYYAAPGQAAPPNTTQTTMITTVNGMPDPSAGYYTAEGRYCAYLALADVPHVSVDWDLYPSPVDLTQIEASPTVFTVSHTTTACL